eukprot:7317-Heterococcus_DN1.PRE.5
MVASDLQCPHSLQHACAQAGVHRSYYCSLSSHDITIVYAALASAAPAAPLHRDTSHSVNFVSKHSMQQMCSPCLRIFAMLLYIIYDAAV